MRPPRGKRLLLLTLLLATVVACGPSGEILPPGEPVPWISEDPGDWPRIAMVNRIRYSDSDHPMAGSAFLLELGDEIVAVTAKHVLRFFKSESMETVSFEGTLVSWEMFPKDDPADVTVIGALINESPDEALEGIRAERDWLFFTVRRASVNVQPLRLRTTPLERGETVFVVGWRYTDEGPQHVYRGEYVRSEEGTVLIDARELRDNTTPGLSGAPVIDAHGYVVGVMSAKAGKLQRLAGIDYAKQVLEEEPRPVTGPQTLATDVEPSADCAGRMVERFRRRGWVGVTPEIDAAGVITCAEVFAGSPAAVAGVQRGDVLHGINGVSREDDPAAFKAVYDSLRPGVAVVFDLERGTRRLALEIRVEPIPEAVLEQWVREECAEARR